MQWLFECNIIILHYVYGVIDKYYHNNWNIPQWMANYRT